MNNFIKWAFAAIVFAIYWQAWLYCVPIIYPSAPTTWLNVSFLDFMGCWIFIRVTLAIFTITKETKK